jgi:hypothetical protein
MHSYNTRNILLYFLLIAALSDCIILIPKLSLGTNFNQYLKYLLQKQETSHHYLQFVDMYVATLNSDRTTHLK